MVRKCYNQKPSRKGVALIVALLFIGIFGAFAAALVTMSSTNVAMAANQAKGDKALMSAQSGSEMMRYLFKQVKVSGKTADADIVTAINAGLQNAAIGMPVTTTTDGTTITVPSVTLNAASSQTFTASITRPDSSHVQVDVTGHAGSISRKISEKYDLKTQGHSVFDFGVATKGPLSLNGNIGVEGVNLAVEASVYIESLNDVDALTMQGNSHIQGDVSIVNPSGQVAYKSLTKVDIGGEIGQNAIKNHVDIGVAPTEFPVPDPTSFEGYATGTVYTAGMTVPNTLTNAVIGPGVNPKFTGGVTINGILYIKQPNVVDFGGNVNITGLVVCEGDVDWPSINNKVIFRGNVSSQSVAALPDTAQFAGLKQETGTFFIGPGFGISMGGNFATLNGAIAASGVEFFGNAGGTIKGSVINYADSAMTLTGNSDLYFNRSGVSSIPAGFVPEKILSYDATSYQEPTI